TRMMTCRSELLLSGDRLRPGTGASEREERVDGAAGDFHAVTCRGVWLWEMIMMPAPVEALPSRAVPMFLCRRRSATHGPNGPRLGQPFLAVARRRLRDGGKDGAGGLCSRVVLGLGARDPALRGEPSDV